MVGSGKQGTHLLQEVGSGLVKDALGVGSGGNNSLSSIRSNSFRTKLEEQTNDQLLAKHFWRQCQNPDSEGEAMTAS